ncbi:hypothetical protein Bbelb_200820 [Branchiostoma belcheri]|nr:hypothetical protein Bbelb_200820 [Branchiostoma belcheri]
MKVGAGFNMNVTPANGEGDARATSMEELCRAPPWSIAPIGSISRRSVVLGQPQGVELFRVITEGCAGSSMEELCGLCEQQSSVHELPSQNSMELFRMENITSDNGEIGDTDTRAQIDDPNNAARHTTDIEDGGALPATVRHNIIGLIGNKMYTNDSTQQPDKTEQPANRTEHEETEADPVTPDDCDDDSDSHTYNYVDRDDINNLRQASQDIQPADEEGDTTQPSSDQQGGSHTTNNTNNLPGQDNNKEP